MAKLFALFVLCALSALGQMDIYKYSKTATIAGSTSFTIALPATGSNVAEILDFTLQCTADCTVETFRNGSAPTGTLGTWRPEDRDTAPKVSGTPTQPAMLIYHASDSTGGEVSDEPFIFPANAIVPWGVGQMALTGAGLTTNWTLKITLTGTYRLQIRARSRR